MQQADDGQAARTVALIDGWNMLGWMGPITPLATIAEGLQGQFQSLHAWDGTGQAFESFALGSAGDHGGADGFVGAGLQPGNVERAE